MRCGREGRNRTAVRRDGRFEPNDAPSPPNPPAPIRSFLTGDGSVQNAMSSTLAFVGTAGGAGVTRVSVECAAMLARAGDSVAVLDAAFGTQGLAAYVEGRVDPDLTGVLTDEAAFGDALVDAWPALDGRVAVCPAHAPFERVARAKRREAARQLENCIDHAAGRFDHVIVDVPPVADNPSVAAVTAVDERVLVAPDSRRGGDQVPRVRGRLVDLGADVDALLANRVDGETPTHLPEADHVVPTGARDAATPTSVDGDGEFAGTVADLTDDLFGRSVEIEQSSQGLLDR